MLIIINGFSGTGKTTLGEHLSKKLGIPMLSADHIKDIIMDCLGTGSTELFHKYSLLSYDFMYSTAEEIVKTGNSVILESSFHNSEDNIQRINSLADKYKTSLKQLFLYADEKSMWERIQKRKNVRHAGHVDLEMSYDVFLEKIKNPRYSPLSISGVLLKINTSNFEKVNINQALEFCKA